MLTTYERRQYDQFMGSCTLTFPSLSILRAYIDLIIERPLTHDEFQEILVADLGHTLESARHIVDEMFRKPELLKSSGPTSKL